MVPIRYENGIYEFSKYDVEIYGCPSYYGYHRFIVLDLDPVYTTDFKQEQRLTKKRLPHLYVREKRFHDILKQLLCMEICTSRKTIDSEQFEELVDELGELEETPDVWIDARRVFKKHGFNNYYNRIGPIFKLSKPFKMISLKRNAFELIMNDFRKMDKYFYVIKDFYNMKYFFNLRYVAVRLAMKHKIEIPFHVPLSINSRTASRLNAIFDFYWLFLKSVE